MGTGSGQGSVPLSGVFHLMECAVLDLAMPWSRDNFKINAVLYDKDRSLCSALEAGVWVSVLLVLSCYVVLYYIMSCHVMSFYIILCL